MGHEVGYVSKLRLHDHIPLGFSNHNPISQVEPQSLIFNGSLEGDYLDDITLNQNVEVHIPKLRTQSFKGLVKEIKQEPITKRGIITFPVIIEIELDANIVQDLENYHAFVLVKNAP